MSNSKTSDFCAPPPPYDIMPTTIVDEKNLGDLSPATTVGINMVATGSRNTAGIHGLTAKQSATLTAKDSNIIFDIGGGTCAMGACHCMVKQPSCTAMWLVISIAAVFITVVYLYLNKV